MYGLHVPMEHKIYCIYMYVFHTCLILVFYFVCSIMYCNHVVKSSCLQATKPLNVLLAPLYIHRNVQKFYCKVTNILFDFKDIPSDVKSKLMDTYCLLVDLNGSQLWKYSNNDVNAFYIAWRKVVRRIWKIPSTTHCNLLPAINRYLPIEFLMEKGCAKFI